MSEYKYGFVCECGGEVSEIWEQITVRGGQGAYRCDNCGSTGSWCVVLGDAEQSELTGCLVRRGDRNE